MTTCSGKNCSFGLWSFVNIYQGVCVLFSLFGCEDGIWDFIVLVPNHCFLYIGKIT